jgi:transcriptional pleiotropic regulator of transition state genes
MKSTGIVRKIDELGRIVLPIELRRTMNLDIKDPVEIFTDEGMIILRKYQPACDYAMQLKRIRDNISADRGMDETTRSFTIGKLDDVLDELEGTE